MKRFVNAPALGLTVILTIALVVLMGGQSLDTFDILVGAGLFFVLNYVFLMLLLRALMAIFRVLRLPGVKLKSYAYWLYPLTLSLIYAAFLLLNIRLTGVEIPVILMAGLALTGLAGLILAQLGGTFPRKQVTQKKLGYRLDTAGGRLGGFELLGSLYGTYDDGIVLGTDSLDYSQLKAIRRSKDVIVVDGHGLPAPEIILVTGKAKQYYTEQLAHRLGASSEQLLLETGSEGTSARRKTEVKTSGKSSGKPTGKTVRSKPVKLLEAQKQKNSK